MNENFPTTNTDTFEEFSDRVGIGIQLGTHQLNLVLRFIRTNQSHLLNSNVVCFVHTLNIGPFFFFFSFFTIFSPANCSPYRRKKPWKCLSIHTARTYAHEHRQIEIIAIRQTLCEDDSQTSRVEPFTVYSAKRSSLKRKNWGKKVFSDRLNKLYNSISRQIEIQKIGKKFETHFSHRNVEKSLIIIVRPVKTYVDSHRKIFFKCFFLHYSMQIISVSDARRDFISLLEF